MPSKPAHVAAALANQRTIDYLRKDDEHLPWVVAIAFYKALHLVEALLAGDPQSPTRHTDDHKTRNRLLKTTNRYRNIWMAYRPLYEASLIARYLREDANAPTYDVFSSYMPKAVVESRVLGHYLIQIEKSVGNLLGEAGFPHGAT